MPQVAEAPEVKAPKTEAPKVQVLVARPVKSNRARWILSLVLLVALVGGVYSWLHSQAFESTDDAQVDAHVTQGKCPSGICFTAAARAGEANRVGIRP